MVFVLVNHLISAMRESQPHLRQVACISLLLKLHLLPSLYYKVLDSLLSSNPHILQMFFGLNLVFNGIMWALFTKALARGTSTTQVSILNTSSNFMITAVLGWMIFSESLPPLWFVGAALLVAGNVIIGRRDEGEERGKGDEQVRAENGEMRNEEAEGLLVGEELDYVDEAELETKKQEEDDVLQLDLEEENHGRSGGNLI